MNIRVNSEVLKNKWQALSSGSLFDSPFQTNEFYEFCNSVLDFGADVFAIEKDSKYLSLVIVTTQKEKGVKGYFSRRGIIYGGPLILEDHENHIRELFKYVREYYSKKLIYLECRNYSDYSSLKASFKECGWDYIPWLNLQKDIRSIDIVKKSISSSRLRQIKKAQSTGVQWRVANDIAEVKDFYEILKNLYKNKIKKPLFPYPFFKGFFESNLGIFLLVEYNNKVIGGIMCPILPNKVIYEYYVCGLDSEYKEQYPSVMATWAAIEYGMQNNIPLFDFMGAGSPDEDYGVREFKTRFGGDLVEHGRYINVLNPFLYSIGKFGLKVIKSIG